MSDDRMKLGVELAVESTGTELIDALKRKVDGIARQMASITKAAKTAAASLNPGRAGTSTTGATANNRAAKESAVLDRQAVASLKQRMTIMSRMAAQHLREERTAFAEYRRATSFRERAQTEESRISKAVAAEEMRAFRERMGFTSRMGRLAIAQERATSRERARSATDALKAENRRAKEAASAIRNATRLEMAETRRVDREKAMALRNQITGHRWQLGLRDRMERQERRESDRSRRDVMRYGSDAGRRGSDAYNRLTRPGTVAAAGGTAATAVAGRRILGSEADTDSAEINARIYANLSKEQARDLRDKWAAPLAEKLGVSTAKLITSFTDAVKLGIPAEGAKQVSELATQTSEAWSVPFETVTETLGTVNTILTSKGEAFNYDKLKSTANALQYLAAKQSTTPEKLISFLQRGAGASQVLGMSQEAGLAFGSASTSLGNQAGQSGRMFDYVASRLVEMPRLVKKHGDEGKQAKELIRALGYGGADDMDRKRRAAPDEFLPDFMKRFNNISDPKKREQAIRFFAGREWMGEFGRMVVGFETYKEAVKLSNEAKGLDAIGEVWNLHKLKLAFVFKQFKAGWLNILGEFGKVLSPLAREVGDYFLDWSRKLQGGGLKARFSAAIQGLIEGGGFKDLPSMMEGVFGKPGEGDAGSISQWKSTSKAFAEGIRDVANAVKGTVSAFVGGDPETIARWTGRILALSVALAALSPVLAVIGGLTSVISALAASVAGIAALKGLTAGAVGGAAVWTVAGGLIGAAFLATVANKIGILKAPDTSKGFGRGVVEFLDPGLASRLYGDATDSKGKSTPWIDPPAKKAVENLSDAVKENTLLHRQSYEAETGIRGLIRKASYTSDAPGQGVKSAIETMGGRIQTAALSGATALGSGISGGSFSGPLASSTPGSRLGGSGLSRRGILDGGGAGGSGGIGASDNSPIASHGGKTFGTIAPRLMADLSKDFGLTKEQAAGIVGNLGHESGGMTAFQEKNPLGGGRGGWGYAQWTGPRRRQFEAWAQARNLDPKSYEANYGFLRHELQTTEKGGISAVKRHSTIEGATVGFERAFERAGIKHDGSRLKWARRAAGLPSVSAGVEGPVIPSPGKDLAASETMKSTGWKKGLGENTATKSAESLVSTGWRPGGQSGAAPNAFGGSARAMTMDAPMRQPNIQPQMKAGSAGNGGNSGGGGNTSITINGAGLNDPQAIAAAIDRQQRNSKSRQSTDIDPLSI